MPALAAAHALHTDLRPLAELVECRILAAASVSEKGGSIAARVEAPGRPALPLFSIAAGRHRKPIDLGEALLGERRFSIVAEIESDAAFLPGDAPEPLVVEGRIAEPRPDLDAILLPK